MGCRERAEAGRSEPARGGMAVVPGPAPPVVRVDLRRSGVSALPPGTCWALVRQFGAMGAWMPSCATQLLVRGPGPTRIPPPARPTTTP